MVETDLLAVVPLVVVVVEELAVLVTTLVD
jgi:hypothetical protein